jgi:hypothetical protein
VSNIAEVVKGPRRFAKCFESIMPTPETTAIPSEPHLGLRDRAKLSVRNLLKSWHRTVGIFAAAFLLLLSSTGLLLMQTDALELDARFVNNNRLLDWYGIRPAPPPVSFAVGDHWITQLGSQLYFDASSLQNIDGQLIGAATAGSEIVVATNSMLVLLTTDGTIAEKLGAESDIPSDIEYLGSAPSGEVVLKTASQVFLFDPQTARLVIGDSHQRASWSAPEYAPKILLDELNQRFRGAGLSIERILLDLHTGRIFGGAGVALINLASLALLVLVISGLILWRLRARDRKKEE